MFFAIYIERDIHAFLKIICFSSKFFKRLVLQNANKSIDLSDVKELTIKILFSLLIVFGISFKHSLLFNINFK